MSANVEYDEPTYISEFPFSILAALAAPWVLWAVVASVTPPDLAPVLGSKAAVSGRAQPQDESIDPMLSPPPYEVRL